MPYDVIEKKIQSIPEAYFQEVSDYLDALIIRINRVENAPFKRNIRKFQGAVSDEDAQIMREAVSECRKVDKDEW